MRKKVEKLNEKITEIASINLADIIHDEDLLAVALCSSNFNEIQMTIFSASEGECKHTAAHRALDIGWNPAFRETKAKEGYFVKGLQGLIELSKQNPDVGSRLMPIFNTMVSSPEEYCLPKKVVRETVSYFEHIRQRDGFAITSIDDDGHITVRPADGYCTD